MTKTSGRFWGGTREGIGAEKINGGKRAAVTKGTDRNGGKGEIRVLKCATKEIRNRLVVERPRKSTLGNRAQNALDSHENMILDQLIQHNKGSPRCT